MTLQIPAALAALRAMSYAIRSVQAELQAELVEDYHATGSDRWRTPYGTVSVTDPKPSTVIGDEDAFQQWVAQTHPDEVVQPPPPPPMVREAFRKAILARLTWVDGACVDTETGQVVEWAQLKPGGDAYVAIRGPERDAAIERARTMISGRLDELASDLEAAPALILGGDE